MDYEQVVKTIIAQMGGYGRLKAMVGAKTFTYSGLDNSVQMSFRFCGDRRHNVCRVRYNGGSDDYTVCFERLTHKKGECSPVFTNRQEFQGVYCDQLIPIFEEVTGLYLSLGTMTA